MTLLFVLLSSLIINLRPIQGVGTCASYVYIQIVILYPYNTNNNHNTNNDNNTNVYTCIVYIYTAYACRVYINPCTVVIQNGLGLAFQIEMSTTDCKRPGYHFVLEEMHSFCTKDPLRVNPHNFHDTVVSRMV